LAVFGVRHQGTFVGAAIGLMIVAAAAQAIPWAVSLLPWQTQDLPKLLDLLVAWLPNAVFTVALVSALQFAACLLIGTRSGPPGMTATLAAALAACGLLPQQIMNNSVLGYRDWSRWMPDGFFGAGLLAAAGLISTRRGSWLLPVFAVAVALPGNLNWSNNDAVFSRTLPVIIALLVAGWMATRPATFRGYVALLACVSVACFMAEFFRGIDARYGMLPYGRLCPLLSAWGIACGSVAIAHKDKLSSAVRAWDMAAKQLLRIRAVGSPVNGRQLAETTWFRKGRARHHRQRAGSSSGPHSLSSSRETVPPPAPQKWRPPSFPAN
jgi:hypothetical protein